MMNEKYIIQTNRINHYFCIFKKKNNNNTEIDIVVFQTCVFQYFINNLERN